MTGSFLSAKSPFNRELPASPPIDSHSAGKVTKLASKVTEVTPFLNIYSFGVPIFKVSNGQTTQKLTQVSGKGPVGLQAANEAVPAPTGFGGAAGSDKHAAIVKENGEYWEYWILEGTSGSFTYWAGGAIKSLPTNMGYFDSTVWPSGATTDWGADAAAMPLVAGTILCSEARAGVIPHALTIGIQAPKATEFVYPAHRTDGSESGENAIPEGTCFRIKPSYNVATSGKSAPAKALMTALQKYGGYVRDTAGNVVLYGQEPHENSGFGETKAEMEAAWTSFTAGVEYNHIMEEIPWSEMEVVNVKKLTEEREAEEISGGGGGKVPPEFKEKKALAGGTGASPTVAKFSGAAVGDILVYLGWVLGSSVAPSALTLTGFETELEQSNEAVGSNKFTVALLWKRVTASEPSSYTFNWTLGGGTLNWRSGVLARYSGCRKTGNPFSGTGSKLASTSGTKFKGSSFLVADPAVKLIMGIQGGNGGLTTPPSGYTTRESEEIALMDVTKEGTVPYTSGEPEAVWSAESFGTSLLAALAGAEEEVVSTVRRLALLGVGI